MRQSVYSSLICFSLLVGLLFAASSAHAKPLVTIAMDARTIGEATHRGFGLLSLQRKLALRPTQASFAVVAASRRPQIRIRFRARSGRLFVEAHRAGQKPLRAKPVGRTGKTLAVVHL